jgi:predicted transport protein
MTDLQKAAQTQLANIEKRSGRKLAELAKLLEQSGLSKFGEKRDYLKRELGMGHGDANAVVSWARDQQAPSAANVATDSTDVLDTIYSGAKAALRPIHDALMDQINAFGDFEIAPKKGYVSLRRKKQFAMIGPATQTRVELGLNMKEVVPGERLIAEPAGKMCNYKVRLSTAAEVDAELIAWIRMAYDSAA